MKKIIITPFLIVIGILEVLLFFMAFYYLLIDNNGGKALGGTIAFIGFILFFIILVIEQSILINRKEIKKQSIWIIETIILICLAIYICINGISIG
ncbi:hypothetical protein GZ212_11330 [Mangrovimonas sp. CR14]|uniref:hypothetical protein n=1 Tax=Mangrovimonas sp. CR14 TaxID=2706120 RepID=UPI0014221553|nr:hypothetical protein [Mangrovimonas sp. CR14]NIK92744.1 hypothetical protein [Mangrovimonas sp. CR14]